MTQLRVLNTWLGGLVREDEGQTLAEYALILALIAVGVIVAVIALQGSISGIFNNVTSQI